MDDNNVIDLTSPTVKNEPEDIPEGNAEGAVGGVPLHEGFHIPEGVDPSYLAALPPDIRDEVIAQIIRQVKSKIFYKFESYFLFYLYSEKDLEGRKFEGAIENLAQAQIRQEIKM